MIKYRRTKWTGYVARMWKRKNAYKVFVENRNSLEDPGMFDIIMLNGFFKGVGWEVVDWIHLAQRKDDLMSTAVN